MNESMPYGIPEIYLNKLKHISKSLEKLRKLSGETINFYLEGESYRISSLKTEIEEELKGVTIAIWLRRKGFFPPVARAQAKEFDFESRTIKLHQSLVLGDLPGKLSLFGTIDFLKEVNPGHAFGIDREYRSKGISQFLFAILLYCLRDIGVENITIHDDRTLDDDNHNYPYFYPEDIPSGIVKPITPSSLYLKYAALSKSMRISKRGEWRPEISYMTISTQITTMQQDIICRVLSNEI